MDTYESGRRPSSASASTPAGHHHQVDHLQPNGYSNTNVNGYGHAGPSSYYSSAPHSQTPSRTSSRGNLRSGPSRHGSFTSQNNDYDPYQQYGNGHGHAYSGPPSPIDESGLPSASASGPGWKRRRSSADVLGAGHGSGGSGGGGYRYHGLRSKRTLLLGMRFGWVVLIIWGEVSARSCVGVSKRFITY